MKIPSKRFVIGAASLLIVLLGAAFILRPVLAGSLSALQNETPTPLPQTSKLAQVWSQFCVVAEQISYVLLAIPADATFEVVQPQGAATQQSVTSAAPGQRTTPQAPPSTPTVGATETSSAGGNATAVPGTTLSTPEAINPDEVACKSLGVTDGKQLVLCRGPKLSVITLSITANGQTEEFPIMPPSCAAEFPTQLPPTQTETLLPITPTAITPTVPGLPTDTPSPSPTP